MGYNLLTENEYKQVNMTIDGLRNYIETFSNPVDNLEGQNIDANVTIHKIAITLAKSEPRKATNAELKGHANKCISFLFEWATRLPAKMEKHTYGPKITKFINWLNSQINTSWSDSFRILSLSEAEDAALQILDHNLFRRASRFWSGRFPMKVLADALTKNLKKACRIADTKQESVDQFLITAASQPWATYTVGDVLHELGLSRLMIDETRMRKPIGTILCLLRLRWSSDLPRYMFEKYKSLLLENSKGWKIRNCSGDYWSLDGAAAFLATHPDVKIDIDNLKRMLGGGRNLKEILTVAEPVADVMRTVRNAFPSSPLVQTYLNLSGNTPEDLPNKTPEASSGTGSIQQPTNQDDTNGTTDKKFEEEDPNDTEDAPISGEAAFDAAGIGSLKANKKFNQQFYKDRLLNIHSNQDITCSLTELLDKIVLEFHPDKKYQGYLVLEDTTKTITDHMEDLRGVKNLLDMKKLKEDKIKITDKERKILKNYEKFIRIATKLFFELENLNKRGENSTKKEKIKTNILEKMGNVEKLRDSAADIDKRSIFGDINLKSFGKELKMVVEPIREAMEKQIKEQEQERNRTRDAAAIKRGGI